MLIGCRILFLMTSSSEIEVCFFFAVCIGLSVVRDVLAAVVSLCQTCPFGNNRYLMLVQKVCAKKSPSKLSDCVTSKSIRAESTNSTIRSARNTRSRYLDLTKISIALLDHLASKRCVELCGCLDDPACWTRTHSLLSFHFHRGQLHWCVFLSLLRHCVRFFIFPHAARPSRGSSVSCRTEVCETFCTFIGVETFSSRSFGGVLRSSRCTICGQIISGVLLLFCWQGLTSIKAR